MLSFEVPRMTALRRRSVALLAVTMGMVFAARAQEKPAPAQPAQPQQPPPQEQPPPADPNQPVFRTGINFVRVDAIVTDRQGKPVAELKQNDLPVFQDNKTHT